MTLDEHLAHLVWLMTVPTDSGLMDEQLMNGWKAYAWAHANELAAREPELADLPRLLTEAMSK